MKQFRSCFLLVLILKLSEEKSTSNKEILSISDGTSFGFCIGYCRKSINITSTPNQLIALKEPNYPQDAYPPVEKTYKFSAERWQQLTKLVNTEHFLLLNDTIGCPDCADGGAEWIEIQWCDQTKRVTFEYGTLIKGFEGLVVQLRNLRDTYIADL